MFSMAVRAAVTVFAISGVIGSESMNVRGELSGFSSVTRTFDVDMSCSGFFKSYWLNEITGVS
jgi:uncharacterized membrane protein